MKEKILNALKQRYSAFGLGGDILTAHAEALDALGLVTEDNLQSVIDAQETYLAKLQQMNDKRVTDAAKSVEERMKREQAEKEAKVAEAEANAKKEAEEKAKKEKEAKDAEERAKREADEKKAKEEQERKQLEKLKKDEDIPEYFKKAQEEALKRATEERKEAEAQRKELADLVKSLRDDFNDKTKAFEDKVAELTNEKKAQSEIINKLKADADAKAAEEAKQKRHEKIISKAKELGIPQFRIDEGINIPDEADDDIITNTLSKMASNYKALGQREKGGYGLQNDSHKVSKEEADDIAEMLCR